MGWSSGSLLAEDIWDEISQYIPEGKKRAVAKVIYDRFCNHYADDWESYEGCLWSYAEPDEYENYIKQQED